MTELQELRRYRRDLHRIPELDFDLPQTIAYIEGVLAPLACEVIHPCPSCVCAFFDAGTGASHATAIRADMDALPIAETTGAAFASTHPGKMHACGHDGHMAMALAAATFVDRTIREQPGVIKRNVLFVFQPAEETTGGAKTVCESGVFERYGGAAFASTHPGKMHACGHDGHMAMALAAATFVDRTIREQPGVIKRNVLFVFQPAEETTGGAKTVCESGVFERYGVDRIFGFHVWPDLPAGTLASCPGPLLARSSETHIHIHGTSIHIAKTYGVPVEESHDAALAAAKFLVAERELMDELGADEPCIGKFGLLQAGTVCNAVAGEAHVAGSLRVFTDAMFDRAREGVRRALDEACTATGCTYDLDFAEGYPPVDNDPELFAHIAPALPELQLVDEPLLIAEDFAFYQRHLPGVFFLLGTGVPEGQENPIDADDCPAYAMSALHTDTMLFDEEILLKGLDVYKRLLLLD